MIDSLQHIYKKGSSPFQTLSLLKNVEAIELMNRLYVEGSVFWKRFEKPLEYLKFRRIVEENLRKDFIKKGGKPKEQYPIYFIYGRSKWLETAVDRYTQETTEKLELPFSIFNREEVSFTYPDSMVSAIMCMEKNSEYYEPGLHGRVFTYEEIRKIIESKGFPGYKWITKMPKQYANYIEAQVWNYDILRNSGKK